MFRNLCFIHLLACFVTISPQSSMAWITEEGLCRGTVPGEIPVCTSWHAVQLQDPTICLKTAAARDACLLEVNASLADPDICELMTDKNGYLYSSCYHQTAKAYQDKDLCEFARDDIDPYSLCEPLGDQTYYGCDIYPERGTFRDFCVRDIDQLKYLGEQTQAGQELALEFEHSKECDSIRGATVEFENVWVEPGSICYAEKFNKDIVDACAFMNDVMCVSRFSKKHKKFYCDKMSKNYGRSGCMNSLFLLEHVPDIMKLDGIHDIRTFETHTVQNLNEIADRLATSRAQTANIRQELRSLRTEMCGRSGEGNLLKSDATSSCQIEDYCDGRTLNQQLFRGQWAVVVGDPFYFLMSCNKNNDGIVVTIATYQ